MVIFMEYCGREGVGSTGGDADETVGDDGAGLTNGWDSTNTASFRALSSGGGRESRTRQRRRRDWFSGSSFSHATAGSAWAKV